MPENRVDVVLLSDVYDGSDARVIRWLRAAGDDVALNEPLVEIETDKVTVEVAAPANGRLTQILKQAADSIATGEVLGHIESAASSSPTTPGASPSVGLAVTRAAVAPVVTGGRAGETTGSARNLLSPAVRTLLQARELYATSVAGTGKDGRITARDVETFVESGARSRRIPHTAMRRRIAANMSRSVNTAPHVTAVFEADLAAVVAHRERHKADFAARGASLNYTAYFVAACVPAFAAMPEINSRFHASDLEVFEDLNIGIGTALGSQGLVVPVLRDVQTLDLFAIATQLGELLDKARSGKLSGDDMKGGTFTISNHGVSGSLLATPIIQQPQSAILGIGKLERRPAVVIEEGAEQVRIRSKCFVTLTIDHRAIDGFQANGFLSAWVKCLESWPLDSELLRRTSAS